MSRKINDRHNKFNLLRNKFPAVLNLILNALNH